MSDSIERAKSSFQNSISDLDQEKIEYQYAEPSYEEGMVAARLIEMSSEGLIPAVFGKDYAKVIATAFEYPDNDFSYQNTVFAIYDGEIIGMALGFSGIYQSSSSDYPIKKAPGNAFRRRLGLLLLRLFVRFAGGYPDNDFYIAFLAVDKPFRGVGIGSKLLSLMEELARSQGVSRISLHVSGGNDDALQLYERFGMQVEDASSKRGWLPRIGRRMIKELN